MDHLKLYSTGIGRGLDILIVLLSAYSVHYFYFGSVNIVPVRMLVLLFSIGALYAIFALGGMYQQRDSLRLSEVLSRLTVCFSLAVAATGLFAFLSKIAIDVSRFWFGSYMLLAFIGLCGYRILYRYYLEWLGKKGRYNRSIVIAGSGSICKFVFNRLRRQTWLGIRVDSVFDDLKREGFDEVELRGSLSSIAQYIEQRRRDGNPISQVWVALPAIEEDKISTLIDCLTDSSVDICVVPSSFGNQLITGKQFKVADLSVVNISEVKLPPFGEWFKVGFDYVFATFAVVFLMPIMLLIALLIRTDSAGKVLFKQRRYGID